MIKVLFLERRHFERGLEDNSPASKVGAILQSLEFIKLNVIKFEDTQWNHEETRKKFFESVRGEVESFRPDLLLLDANPISKDIREWFLSLKKEFSCKVAVQFFYLSNQLNFAYQWLEIADYLLIVEHSSYCRLLGRDRVIFSPVPPDLPITGIPVVKKKTIDVSFIGDIFMHSSRRKYLEYVRQMGMNVVIGGGYGKGRLTSEEYFRIMSESKIVVNFCAVPNGNAIIKERPFEAFAANALLLEEKGSEVDRIFSEGKEFMHFSSREELADRVKWLLAHETERSAIAERGHQRYLAMCRQVYVWSYIFKRMGFEIPRSIEADMYFREYVDVTDRIVSDGEAAPKKIHKNEQWPRDFYYWFVQIPARMLVPKGIRKIIGDYLDRVRRQES